MDVDDVVDEVVKPSSIKEQWDVVKGSATPLDQWEFDRAQATISLVDEAAGTHTSDAEAETAARRSREAQAIQMYLIKKNAASEAVNGALDAADAAWVAKNPRPPSPPDPEESEGE